MTNSQLAVRIGSQRPAFLSLPAERLGSAGSEAVELAAMAGLDLDDWQAWLLAESMQQNATGRWSAFEVALLVARQNGKGGWLEARQLAGLFLNGEQLAVHTAHEFKTCFEHFLRIVALIENTPDLDARVQRIRRGAGEQSIELRTGERLRFLARSAGSGRGMSGDTVYLDEAFALTPQIMGALLPTLSAVPNPQLVYTSSHPSFSQRVLWELVQRGRRGDSPRLLYADWGNPAGVQAHDREAWYRANPALGIRIDEQFVIAEMEAMRAFPDEFLRERLGVLLDSDASGAISLGAWNACVDAESSAPAGFPALAIGPGMEWAALGFAGLRADGRCHLEVVRHGKGTQWIVEAALNACADTNQPLIVDPKSPTAGLVDRLRSAGVVLREVSGSEFVTACAALQDEANNGTIRHLGQPALTEAITGADIRPVGEAWAFSARASNADITPLLAVTLAAVGARSPQHTSSAGGFVDLNDVFSDDDD